MTRAFGSGERAQIVGQGLALLSETGFYEVEKSCGVGGWHGCGLAGKSQGNERRGHFRRRAKSCGWQAEDKFRAGIELSGDGEIAVLAGRGAGGEASGDFELDDDMGFVNVSGVLEKVMEDRRSDVVREIAVDAHAAAGGKGREIGFEDVCRNDGEIGMSLCETLESGDEGAIEFNGDYGSAGLEEMVGHFAVAGADFDPAEICGGKLRGRRYGVRRDADGAGYFFAPTGVAEEMLTEFLSGHEMCSECSRRRELVKKAW